MCGRINKNNLCPQCKIKLKEITKANIIKVKNKNFTYLAYLFKYDGIIREKILKYKFKDSAYLYKTFSEIIIKNKKMCGFIKKYDIIIPVPIHKKRYTFILNKQYYRLDEYNNYYILELEITDKNKKINVPEGIYIIKEKSKKKQKISNQY